MGIAFLIKAEALLAAEREERQREEARWQRKLASGRHSPRDFAASPKFLTWLDVTAKMMMARELEAFGEKLSPEAEQLCWAEADRLSLIE